MIRVDKRPEPSGFEQKVRTPGFLFLTDTPKPSRREWQAHAYWQDVIDDLYQIYGGLCAYCAEWIPQTTGDPTVDHFVPKSINSQLAYEWSNFRLSSLRFNRWKREFRDVLDPFEIGQDWFQLLFPSLQVVPNPTLPRNVETAVTSTISRLRLNHGLCIASRLRWVKAFCQPGLPFDFLRENAPFIAREIQRQGLIDTISLIMSS